MKLFLGTLLMLAAVQVHPERYPPGWRCSPTGTIKSGQHTTEHPCQCRRVDRSPDCEGEARDRKCRQQCFEKEGKCACPVACEPSEPSEAREPPGEI